MWVSYIFIALEINTLYRNICILSRNVYVLYKQYIYTVQFCVATSGVIVHCVGEVVSPLIPQEMHCGSFVSGLCNIFQENSPGIK